MRVKNQVLASIENNVRREVRERMQREIRRGTERARQSAKVAGLLAAAGIPVVFDAEKASWPEYELTVDQLVAARHALGKFEHYSTDVETENSVAVKLRCVAYPEVRVRYVRELPAGAKCKIVTTVNTYTNRSLVCDRKGA